MTWWFLRWFFLPSYKRTSAVEIDTPRSAAIPLPLKKDDFTILKGVGPKTSAGLYQAGIYTFEQLGLMDLNELIQSLKDHGLPTSSASSWQEQAALAAAEDWEGLQKLQE
jgi:predicted flap endonuclease-1-like 5' DNA nuclease